MKTRTAALLAITILTITGLALAACGSDGSGARDGTVTLVTHDSFAISRPVLRAFREQTGVTVKVLRSGDAGAPSTR